MDTVTGSPEANIVRPLIRCETNAMDNTFSMVHCCQPAAFPAHPTCAQTGCFVLF